MPDKSENENQVDKLLRSDAMAKGGVHAIQWKGTHWRCGCGCEFGDSDEQIAAFCAHAPGQRLLVFSSHDDPDVKLAAARMGHALETRMPAILDGPRWLHLPLSRGKSTSFIAPLIVAGQLAQLLAKFARSQNLPTSKLTVSLELTKAFIDTLDPQELVQIGCWDDAVIQEAMTILKTDYKTWTISSSGNQAT